MSRITVQYTFTASNIALRWHQVAEARNDVKNVQQYLLERGITTEPGPGVRSFIITHASTKRRMATELMMSGCTRTCNLTTRVILS